MSRPNIAVDVEKRSDMYYRYTMPPVITKVEGSGNGIKTVFPNMVEVCAAINRPVDIVMKFLQFECGAQRTVSKDQKCLLMGKFPEDRIQSVVDDFIVKFVLCEKCRSPETDFTVENRDLVSHCDACGARVILKNVHKVYTSTFNYYKMNQTKSGKKKDKKEVVAAEKEAAPRKAVEEQVAAAPAQESEQSTPPPAPASTSPAAQEAEAASGKEAAAGKKSEVKDNVESPVTTIHRILKGVQQSSPDKIDYHTEIISYNLRQLLQRYCYPNYYGAIILLNVFAIAFPCRICEAVQKYNALMKLFTSATEIEVQSASGDESKVASIRREESKQRVNMLKDTTKLFVTGASENAYYTVDRLIHLVFVMYVEGIVDATNIEKWLQKPYIIYGGMPQETLELRTKILPLTHWLGIKNPIEETEAENAVGAQ